MVSANSAFLTLLGCTLALTGLVQAEDKIYKMCVPQMYYEDCLTLLKDPSEAGIQMECVAGRDRMDCLEMIEQNKADVLASEPEDMYVAYHQKNDDYRVVSEIRTQEDKDEDFRYQGIILVKKNSNIHSLKDLQGSKSCHTGFGRNVGFKIPMTKLRNANILTIDKDPAYTTIERELKALSEFFSQSCLVGKYSPHPEVDRTLKKKYANLCALCEQPEKCDYPDKFSGYDGAIRCLDQGKGDVAFTKVQFVKKYFGLDSNKIAEGDASDFEYLCEDGSRVPITEPACSWAQRPWAGYLANTNDVDNTEKMHDLQDRLSKFYENGLHAVNKDAAAHLLINQKNGAYHAREQAVDPKQYLERAGYKDVIERDGSAITKVKLCVKTDLEMAKCNAMQRAAYSRDIRPEMMCVQSDDCKEMLKTGEEITVTAGKANDYEIFRNNQLMPIVFENFGDNVYVAVIQPRLDKETLDKTPINFDKTSERAMKAAAYLNKKRGLNACEMEPEPAGQIQIVHTKQLENYKDKMLLCDNLEQKPVTEFRTCNVEVNLPIAVFAKENLSPIQIDTIKHLFTSLADQFGPFGKHSDVFTLFGEFTKGQNNVIFDDDAVNFMTEMEDTYEKTFNELKC